MDTPHGWQPPPPGGGGGGGKSKRKKRRHGTQQLGPRQGGFKQQQPYRGTTSLGFFGQVPMGPSLEQMRAANQQRTRHHFNSGPRQKSRRQRSAPKSIPRAPEHHAATFPPGANPLDTPAPEIAAFPAAADKLEAEGLDSGLDFYGTNDGMMGLFRNRSADSGSEQSELEGPSGDEEYVHEGGAGGRPTSLAARLAEQEAYIANLEDENLRLRERLDMLQQELNDLRHGRDPEQADSGGSVMSGGSSEDHSVAHVAEAAAGPEPEPSPS